VICGPATTGWLCQLACRLSAIISREFFGGPAFCSRLSVAELASRSECQGIGYALAGPLGFSGFFGSSRPWWTPLAVAKRGQTVGRHRGEFGVLAGSGSARAVQYWTLRAGIVFR
jgi:hypothetical protein